MTYKLKIQIGYNIPAVCKQDHCKIGDRNELVEMITIHKLWLADREGECQCYLEHV